MSSQILPSVHDARITVDVIIDEISEAFDTGQLSRSLAMLKPTFFDKLFGCRQSMDIDTHVKRCLSGIGTIHANAGWKDPPVGWEALWPKDQKIIIAVKPKNYLWLDEEFRPMLGYVSGLETEYRRPDSVVIVDLELLPYVAHKLFQSVDNTITRPNTKPSLSMDWRFTQSYKTGDGQGSGAALWYPYSATFFRGTKRLPAEA